MVSTFENPVLNPQVNLGMQGFDDGLIVKLHPNASEQDFEMVIQAVYRQVLGNAHVMESERLTLAESRLRNREISVREFVRQVAMSSLYRDRFVDSCTRSRTIELNFKHLLGRAPTSYDEIVTQGQIYESGGYEAEIDSYLDSAEYQQAFGEDTVPYARGYKTQKSQTLAGFTHWFSLVRSTSSSDKDLAQKNRPRLNRALMENRASTIRPLKRLADPADKKALIRRALGLKDAPVSQPTSFSAPAQPMASGDANYQNRYYQAYQSFKDADPFEYVPGMSASDLESLIRSIYRQVLGNAYVMDSERLVVPESQLRSGEISVREFIRQVAKSDLYRSRFFEPCYWYRAIELNFKHLLGRAPDSFDEMRYHSSVLDAGGYEAEIDSYLDSDEYQSNFGENIVPYYRGYQTQPGQSMLEFTNMLQLLRSASSSDKDLATNQKPRLTRALIQNSPYGKLKVSDTVTLVREVLKAKQTQGFTASSSTQDSAMTETLNEQASVIATLKSQLADLQRSASIGAAITKSDQYNAATTDGSLTTQAVGNGSTVAAQVKAQAAEIESLKQQIAQSRALAAVGEARLNRWKTRLFN